MAIIDGRATFRSNGLTKGKSSLAGCQNGGDVRLRDFLARSAISQPVFGGPTGTSRHGRCQGHPAQTVKYVQIKNVAKTGDLREPSESYLIKATQSEHKRDVAEGRLKINWLQVHRTAKKTAEKGLERNWFEHGLR
ncbi:hypothetical protein L596_011966 [Steinernema carpocapsae]|uniref:Uncharacterized protein n=1 Tax=Steinernema carpocapsae TaxID=34508 RepID=A0A4U5NWH8_STECR|nr:hypothetical protein L596_011966 [Steinernema carpocapsae]